jgi:SAM-dependent methyltransferase
MDASTSQWAVTLFRRSVLKQAKYRRVLELMDDPAGKTNLDIGADNGVISYLLRQLGGEWYSADLDPSAVASIRSLVQENVCQLDGRTAPFPDRSFDQVIVVDLLEHLPDDRGFIGELARILKPGGTLMVNVPHLKPRSLLNRFRHRIGLTDEWHGHVRPGYSLADLQRLLEPEFLIERVITYSRSFSELIDTGLNGVYLALKGSQRDSAPSSKGTVLTRSDVERMKKEFWVLTALYPALWSVAHLDALLPFQAGYKLMVRAKAVDPPAAPQR